MRVSPLLFVLSGGVVFALACAGGPKCGEGTVEQDGECVADGGTAGEGDADTDTDADTDADGAPEILSFSSNSSRITAGDTLVFTAVVTDPDGISDLIGGTLESSTGGTYGSFATASDEGAYEISLSWNAINTVSSIDFSDQQSRNFVARFYDAAGHTAESELSVTLTCDGDAACGGDCVDLQESLSNCGECGNQCVGFQIANYVFSAECYQGACIAPSECTADLEQNCTQVCAGEGMSCYPVGDPGVVVSLYSEGGDLVCDDYRDSVTTSSCSQDLTDVGDARNNRAGTCVCLAAP